MIQIPAKFLAFLLVLIYIGVADYRNLGRPHDAVQLVRSGLVPSAAALPIYPSSLKKGSKKIAQPRVGVVVKPGKMNKLGNKGDGDGKGKAQEKHGGDDEEAVDRTHKAKEGSSFPNTHGRVGMTLKLKRLEHPAGRNALMLYQHHINRANAKLASIFKRAPIRQEEMKQALEKRKLSVLARRSTGLQTRSTPSSSSSSSDVSVPASERARRRYLNPRLGYVKQPKTGLAVRKRLLGGLLDGILGIGGGSSSDADEPTSPTAESTLSMSSASEASTATPTGKTSPAAAAAATSGFPETNLEASTATELFEAEEPTTAQSLGIDIEANDIGYIVTIGLGSDDLPFRMLVDSGSADTWVPGVSCRACGASHRRLSSWTSKSFRSIESKFSIAYGTGDVEGKLAQDRMTIANMTLVRHTLGLAEKESEDFSGDDVPFDGLIGLAKTELSNAGVATPIDALYEEGLVEAPVMGYRLGRVSDGYNDGEVTFGGIDASKFEGELTEIENVSDTGFWEAMIDKVSYGGRDLKLRERTAILDTGTSLIVAPEADARALHAAIPGAKADGQGGYTIPCTTTDRVALSFGGRQFDIDPRDLLFLPVDENDLEGDCVSAVSAGDVGEKNQWLVGATFLKNVYFATNAKTNTIGLAPVSS
ncbi:hypothetical protein ACQY0O_001990 [Thecaphora frezii]